MFGTKVSGKKVQTNLPQILTIKQSRKCIQQSHNLAFQY